MRQERQCGKWRTTCDLMRQMGSMAPHVVTSRRAGAQLLVGVLLGLGRSQVPLTLLLDTGSTQTWGCVGRRFLCARAGDDMVIAYADGSGVRAQACAAALTLGGRVLRGVPFGAARNCGPSSVGILGIAPALGGIHDRIRAPIALCAAREHADDSTARGPANYTLSIGADSCTCARGRMQLLPVLGTSPSHWRIELFGARLEIRTAHAFGSATTISGGAHTLNESRIIGPLLRTVVPLSSGRLTAMIDSGATHIFAPANAVRDVGLHALAPDVRLVLDLGGPASGGSIRSYSVPLTPHARGCVPGARAGWREKLEGMAATLAIHPRPEDPGEEWVLGMPFLDALRGGVGFTSDASHIKLFADCWRP